ncbi:hypothetical protein D3C74_357940 [compost metagenome]
MIRQNRFFLVEFVTFQQIKCRQSDQALSIRRNLPYIVSTIGDGDGIDPLRLKSFQILASQITTVLRHKGMNAFGQFSFVKVSRFALANLAQSRRMIRRAPHLSSCGDTPAWSKCLKPRPPCLRITLACIDLGCPCPVAGQPRGKRVTFLRIADGWFQRFRQREPPETAA